MFCISCGEKIAESIAFCTNCGKATPSEVKVKISQYANFNQGWSLRLARVVYIGLYIILPLILIAVWDENSRGYYGSTGDAFWLTLITFVAYVVSTRLIKITFFYIAFAQKPRWEREFKRFF